MGEPYFKFKEIAQKFDIAIFSSNYTLYQDFSNKRKIFQFKKSDKG